MRTALDAGIQRRGGPGSRELAAAVRPRISCTPGGAVVPWIPTARCGPLVGGRDYGASQFNRATDALRQPGSSFKPYVYATALMNGFKPTSIMVDSPVCVGNWCPQNYSTAFSGSMTLTQALARSINVIPVKISIALGKGQIPRPVAPDHRHRPQDGPAHAAARHPIAADRRHRGDGARSHRRLYASFPTAARR